MPFDHPAFVQTADGKGIPYVHVPRQEKNGWEPYRLLAEKSLSYFEELKKKGGNVYVDTLTYEEFGLLTELDVKKRFSEIKEKDKFHREEGNELRYMQDCQPEEKESPMEDRGRGNGTLCERRKLIGEDTIMNRLVQWKYSQEQKDGLHRMMSMGDAEEGYSCHLLSRNRCGKNAGNQKNV